LFAPEEGGGDETAQAAGGVEGVVRAVLGRWDFRAADGWRPLLAELCPTGGSQAEAGRLLERFAASEERRRLAGAAALRRGVEYLLVLEEGLPAVFGHIDFLWQDGDGRWHLLAPCFEPVSGAGREACWKQRQTGLVLAAAAVQRQTGAWPRSVTLAFLPDGSALGRPGSRLPHASVLAAVKRGLAERAP
jgi:hypothetical protein